MLENRRGDFFDSHCRIDTEASNDVSEHPHDDGYRAIRQLTNSVTRRFGDKAGRFGERLGRFGNTIGRFGDNFTNSVTGGSDAIQ